MVEGHRALPLGLLAPIVGLIPAQRDMGTSGTLASSRYSELSRVTSSDHTARIRSPTRSISEPHSDVARVNPLCDHLAPGSAQQEQSATHTHAMLGASVGLTAGAIAGYAIALHNANDCHWSESQATELLRDRRLSFTTGNTRCGYSDVVEGHAPTR